METAARLASAYLTGSTEVLRAAVGDALVAAAAAVTPTPPPPPKPKKPAEPPEPKSFNLRGRRGKVKTPSREFLKALDRALPEHGGQGDYWRTEVLAARYEYPPRPTATPPKRCRRYGDRGRLYPGYYVRSHAPSLARRGTPKDLEAIERAAAAPPETSEVATAAFSRAPDPSRHGQAAAGDKPRRPKRGAAHRRPGFVCCIDCYNEVELQRRIAFAVYCGAVEPDGVALGQPEADRAEGPAEDKSASAGVLGRAEATGAEFVELKLEPEDDASLQRLIDRYAPGHQVKPLQLPQAES